ncbi:TIGR03619 family F420-dependent LLM class oxidoreductase [Fodinicola feengrottensis]|uniref:TIGR03619 family F420-dependent LLM class oxidoreductase n=1 Tax=Fodinicola feengrottensis TaxID=435914 RepID=UPI002442AD6E|nr:TIGR03619 family F420-dependent LLM class oxidoreductase [Fodinicola feengrottensis]
MNRSGWGGGRCSCREITRAADALGYHTAWLPDHVLPPGPYGMTYGGVYEPLVTLGHLAGTTTNIRLGTSVLILPLRDPFLVAKQVATIDRLSEGRVTLGVGIGWEESEFTALRSDFGTRAARTDEAVALLRHLFAAGAGPFEGTFYGFEDGFFEPRPDHPVPIMVGGTSDGALRRVARLADSWQGFGIDAPKFAERVAFLKQQTDRPIAVGTRTAWDTSLDDLISAAVGFAAAGAEHLAIHFGEPEGYVERMSAAMHGITGALKKS